MRETWLELGRKRAKMIWEFGLCANCDCIIGPPLIICCPGCFYLLMSDLLLDINLQQLPDDYFGGEWQVANRVLNRNDPHSPLALATRLVLCRAQVETKTDPARPRRNR